MKKYIILILIFQFLSISLFSQISRDTLNQTDKNGKKIGYWLKTDNGKKIYEGKFKEGIPFGTFKYYDSSGKKIKSIVIFSNNGKVSHTTIYHDNGNIMSKGKFVDKIKDSTWVYFADNGTKIGEEIYVKGKKHGNWKTYDYGTKNLLEEVGWKNDLKNGASKRYFTDGKLRYHLNYVNDIAQGNYFIYYNSGQILEKGVYKNSLKDSISTIWNEEGKIIRKIYYDKKGFIVKDLIWVWNNLGKQEIFIDSISYMYRNLKDFVIVNKDGNKIKGTGMWNYYFDILNDRAFMKFGTEVIGSINSVKKVQKNDAETYQIFFKIEMPTEIYLNEEEVSYLRALRPNLFSKIK